MTTAAPEGRRERKKAQTRQLISDTATRMFIERGFDHVTVKEIADAADVSPTTVFKHFPTKESLVFDEGPGQQAELVAAVRDRPAGQGVLDAIEAHLSAGRMLLDPTDPQFQAFLRLVADTPALRDHERQMLQRREGALADAIATTSGPSVSPAAAAALARWVLGAYDLARDQPDRERAFAELMGILRHGWPAGAR
jgi:AcrR family transcriptional regulator